MFWEFQGDFFQRNICVKMTWISSNSSIICLIISRRSFQLQILNRFVYCLNISRRSSLLHICDGDWQNGTRCGIYDFALWRRKVVNVVVTWKRAPAVEVIAGRNLFSLKVELKESFIYFFHPCNLLLSILIN